MSSNLPIDTDIDEVFFDLNCINVNPSAILQKIPITNRTQFSIININVRSLAKNFGLLLSLLKISKMQYTIIVLTETWLKDSDDTLFNIPGYEHISVNRRDSETGGGLRIYYSTSINFIATNEKLTGIHDSHECLSAEFNIDKKYKLHVIGIYRPPKSNIKSFIKHLKENKITHNPNDTNIIKIVAGDMNIAYNLHNLNIPRDHQAYFELFTSNAFKFHITKPTRLGMRGNRDTIIDHIWSNCLIDSHSFTINFKISDHLPNAVIFNHNISTKPSTSKFYDFSIGNLENFMKNKRNAFQPLIDHNIVDIEYSMFHLYEEILKITKNYFPVCSKQSTSRHLNTPWLTRNMKKCLRRKHKLYELYKNNKIQYSIYKDFSCILRKIINYSKANYEKDLLNDLGGNSKEIWKKINALMRPSIKSDPPFIIDSNKTSISDSEKIADAFVNMFDELPNELVNNIPDALVNHTNNIKTNPKSMLLFPTTPNEIILIIKDLKPNNSTDDIPTKLLKLANEEISLILSKLFNKMIEVGIYPSLLKYYRTTPVHKKGSKTDINNYRPISVLKTIDKIFEKLLYVRLEGFFNKYNLFSDNQFGFSKGKSTGIAVTKLIHTITEHLNNNTYSICIFADLSKAFDTVDHELLVEKLSKYGVRGIVLKLFESFLTNREHRVKFKNSFSKKVISKRGVPQGSCLGPLLYSIYIADIENVLKNCDLTIYADDITIEISGNNLSNLAFRANEILKTFTDYCHHNLATISIQKSFYMIFSNSPVTNTDLPAINLCNEPLKKVDSVVYLGVHIDAKLKFKDQADFLRGKLNTHKAIARRVNNKLTLIPAKIYYFSLIQSYILYGLPVWGGALFVNGAHDDLQAKQDKIIRSLFSKYFPRKTLNDVYKTLNIPKIKQLYKIHVSIYIYDIINTNLFPQLKAATNALIFKHDYNTRRNSLLIPLNNFTNFRYNFIYNAIKVWNDIPADIKKLTCNRFKTEIKKHFMHLQE